MPTQTKTGLYSAEALQRLRLVPRGSLVLMTAPWGFGKSALLSAWERTLGASGLLRVALSPQDQRPRDVLQQIASSPQRRSGHHSERGRDHTLGRHSQRRSADMRLPGIEWVCYNA